MKRPRILAAGLAALATAGATLAIGSPASAAPTIQERQWWLQSLQIPQAHAITKGAGVTVAVIDGGVGEHPDLAGQVLTGASFSDANNPRSDLSGHGTGCAALIAGKGATKNNLLGIAPEAKILPIQITLSGDMGSGSTNSGGRIAQETEAIRWAVDHGAKVISMSYGGSRPGYVWEYAKAFRYAMEKDVVLVASAGNYEQQKVKMIAAPAEIPGVVAVGGTTETGEFWTGTQTGPEMVIAAPATNIVVPTPITAAKPNGGYALVPGGTSASAPLVAGAAALIRAKYPNLSAGEVINRLIRTADDINEPGRDEKSGFGRLNVLKALTADVPKSDKKYPLGLPEDPAVEASRQAAEDKAESSGRIRNIVIFAAAGGGILLLLVVLGAVLITRRSRRRAAAKAATAWPGGPGSPGGPGQWSPGAAGSPGPQWTQGGGTQPPTPDQWGGQTQAWPAAAPQFPSPQQQPEVPQPGQQPPAPPQQPGAPGQWPPR